jgi:hypothetical protein
VAPPPNGAVVGDVAVVGGVAVVEGAIEAGGARLAGAATVDAVDDVAGDEDLDDPHPDTASAIAPATNTDHLRA